MCGGALCFLSLREVAFLTSNVCEFLIQFAAAVAAGLFLTLLVFIFGETIFGLPEVSGAWTMESRTAATAHEPFQDMTLTYSVQLAQQGSKIYGYGEKTNEVARAGPRTYTGAARVQIEVKGYITRRILRRSRFVFLIREHGKSRMSSTVHLLCKRNDRLVGKFRSTIADSRGEATWSRSP
jgi:hypothetical protein